ncbi:MAG: ABC transporter permease, partial [Acidimicrobiales bacterium]
RSPRPGTPAPAPAGRRGPVLGAAGLVARREIHERLRGRLFKGVTLVLLAVVAAAIVIPTIHSGPGTTRIGVAGTLSPALQHEVVRAADSAGARPKLVTEPGIDQARAALQAGRVDLVVDGNRSVLTKTPLGSGDATTLARTARSIATTLGAANAFAAAHLSPAQESAIAGAEPVPVTSLTPKKNGTAIATSVIGLILTFVMLTQYNTWTLMGVMEEKSSRVVEVLLATVRPVQLLTGKVLGIGLLALLQAGLVVATALIVAEVVGSDLLHGTAPLVVVATLVWLVLGYAFYCWVYAAAGSMAERQDQIQSLALPLSLPIIVGYIVALTAASTSHPSLLIQVLAYLPPTAPFAMPVLVAAGTATWWGFLFAVLLSIACTVVVARLAAGIYRRAVLRTGGRVRVRELLASGR